MENIQNLQASVKRDESEIQRLDGLKKSIDSTVKSNDVQISTLIKTSRRRPMKSSGRSDKSMLTKRLFWPLMRALRSRTKR